MKRYIVHSWNPAGLTHTVEVKASNPAVARLMGEQNLENVGLAYPNSGWAVSHVSQR